MRLNFGTNSIASTGQFFIQDTSARLHVGIYFDLTNCFFAPGTINYHSYYAIGSLSITKYDLANKIFSGTFEFTLFDPATSCDTIRITQGRFDKKLN